MVAALVVICLGWAVLAAGPEDWLTECPAMPDTASYAISVDFTPPNTRTCTVTEGSQVSERSWTPWDAWALVLLWAAAAAVLVAHGRVLVRLAAASGLWLAGAAMYFV